MAKPIYLLDANVFIQAKNLHYRFEFCEGFWELIAAAHKKKLVYSVEKVKKELLAGNANDPLRKWAQKLPPTFFLPDQADPSVMNHYGNTVATILAEKQYSQVAKNEFADGKRADAFLVAAAKRHDAVLVTQEKAAPQAVASVPIPNAAALMGVQTMTIFEMLNDIAEGTFDLK